MSLLLRINAALGAVFLIAALLAGYAAAFLVVNVLLYQLVVRPFRQIARVADQVSRGDMSAENFPQRGATEIVSVTHSFDRMRKSLEKALRMLGS
jgi:HAMP domain-containing protein